ncbi:MAG: hypothetical protein GC152_03420 [Alphaproteobacteria bacterium]|nr:hypothetical protein [Alphaproteobacteria bacterium]
MAGAAFPDGNGFRGFSLADAAAYMVFSSPASQSFTNDVWTMDDFTYRTADNVVPLPGAAILFASALLAGGAARRRKTA